MGTINNCILEQGLSLLAKMPCIPNWFCGMRTWSVPASNLEPMMHQSRIVTPTRALLKWSFSQKPPKCGAVALCLRGTTINKINLRFQIVLPKSLTRTWHVMHARAEEATFLCLLDASTFCLHWHLRSRKNCQWHAGARCLHFCLGLCVLVRMDRCFLSWVDASLA